ncbi:MAG: hypothetical protein ACRC8S_16575 [Fimbriiglobus sp.]
MNDTSTPRPMQTALVPVPRTRPDRAKVEPPNPALQILTYLRLHALLILFCGTFLGAGLAYAAWSLLPNKYESYAMLQVASSPTAIAMGNDPTRGKTDFTTYVKTTAQLIKSDFVLNSALSDPTYQISKLEMIQSQKNPIKFLEEKLVVTFSEGSEVIKISLEGDQPNDVRSIVEAVKEAYFREVVEKDIRVKSDFKLKVEKAKTSLEGIMKTRMPVAERGKPGLPTRSASNPIMQAGGVPVPEVPGTGIQQTGVMPANPALVNNAANLIAESDVVKKARFPALMGRLNTFEVDLMKFPKMIKERQAKLDSVKKKIDELTQAPPPPEALVAAESDPEVAEKLAEAAKKKRDHEYIRNVANNPNSEKISRMKAEADTAEAEAQAAKQAKAAFFHTARNRAATDKLVQEYEAIEAQLRELKESEDITKDLFNKAKKELSELPPELKKEEEKAPLIDPERTDLLTLDDMYKRLTSQIISLDFELQSPPRVRKVQDASAPSAKDPKKQYIMTAAAGLMGFVLMSLAAVGFEMRAKKISSLGELKAVGTTPIIGVLPWAPTAATFQDPLKKLDITEALDKLRSVVSQTWLSKGMQTIAVTSPLGDEGKAMTAFGLANSLAQSGIRTLILDFDLRHPTLHQIAGVPNQDGICEILRGSSDTRAGQVLLPSGLAFLPAGQWTDEMRRTAVGAQLELLLREVKENYECIILHGHGLLSVADSIEIVRRSDAVLLCTQYRETRSPLLKRALDRLTSLEVPAVGIVYVGSSRHEALC